MSILTFKGHSIKHRVLESGRVQYSATDMANVYNLTKSSEKTQKLLGDYVRLKSTKAYIQALSTSMGIPILSILEQTGNNGTKEKVNTWVDSLLAIHFAQWLSPEFGVQVSQWTEQLLTKGTVSLKPMSQRDVLRELAKVATDMANLTESIDGATGLEKLVDYGKQTGEKLNNPDVPRQPVSWFLKQLGLDEVIPSNQRSAIGGVFASTFRANFGDESIQKLTVNYKDKSGRYDTINVYPESCIVAFEVTLIEHLSQPKHVETVKGWFDSAGCPIPDWLSEAFMKKLELDYKLS